MITLKEFIIRPADDGRKLEKWLIREMPLVSFGQRQKNFRLKRYKINGHPAHSDARLATGDVLNIYLNDESFVQPKREDPFLSRIRPSLDIIYEDNQLMLVDKRPGLLAHPDAHEKVNTLLTHAQALLYQRGEYDSRDPAAFAPALVNRIDRFTGGIVIIAKTQAALDILNQKIRDREIEKFYYCIVFGRFSRREGTLDSYINKDADAKKVRVSAQMEPGGQRALTRYREIAYRDGLSLLECELLTGRTHQIRAQMAFAGHPLLGDGQYGDSRRSERYHRSYQALYAYRLRFSFCTDAGALAPLNNQEFCVRDVRFIGEYFPEVTL